MPPHAGDVSLRSEKLAAELGAGLLTAWPAGNTFLPDGPSWHFERPLATKGSPQLLADVLYQNPLYRGQAVIAG